MRTRAAEASGRSCCRRDQYELPAMGWQRDGYRQRVRRFLPSGACGPALATSDVARAWCQLEDEPVARPDALVADFAREAAHQRDAVAADLGILDRGRRTPHLDLTGIKRLSLVLDFSDHGSIRLVQHQP